MDTFALNLLAADHGQRFSGVTTFVGEDATGSFGIQAHHARFMTTLVFGLARFRLAADAWHYVAMPGAVLYFNGNELSISTRHFLIDTDLGRISGLLEQQLFREEEKLHTTRDSLQRMEQAMLKRMLALKSKTPWQ
ncbi:MAG: F0F1 ATP synthase subunit epsilon [Methylococcales bacterium]|nr:F0F1 ATP synthase subunit epsilon [Methylococcales bacterium]